MISPNLFTWLMSHVACSWKPPCLCSWSTSPCLSHRLLTKSGFACLFCHVWTSLYSPTPLQSTLGSHRQQTSAWTSVAWLGLWSLHSCSSLGLLLGPPPSHSLLMLPPLCPSPQAQAQCPPSSFARFVLVLKVAWRVLALIWVAWAWTQLTSW